jgi:signal transduction histidine kinase/ligand-binding sensor domain-containing protein
MLSLGLALPGFALADEDDSAGQDYVVKVFGADDGLTEASVTDVAQTPEGYLWVGTLFGSVLRFDGTRFVRFNSANTPEFSLKWGGPWLMVDQGGTLWISMHDGGITTWDKHGFRSVFISTNSPNRMLWSAPGRVIFEYDDGRLLAGQKAHEQWSWQTVTLPDISPPGQQCADAEGRIWYLQGENKIGIWNGMGARTLTLAAGLEGQTVKVLVADAQGRIWIGTDQTLAVWQTNHFEMMTPTNGEDVLDVKRIVPSGGGSLWVEANGRMRRCAGRQWLAESGGWNHELGTRESMRFLRGDKEGGLWSGAGDLGLIHVAPDGSYRRLTTKDGLPSNAIGFAFEDRDGDIWTGYDRGGLVQVRPRLFRNIGMEQGLGDSLIDTASEDAQGVVWIGTHSGLVGRYENGVCTNLTLPGHLHPQNSCVAAAPGGRLWIGAGRAGLLLGGAGEMRQIATMTQLQGYPRLLLPGPGDRLWVGTLLSIIQVADPALTVEYTAQSVDEHPTALAAADGTVWAGTLGGLLLHWDGRQFVPLVPPDQSSLGRIWALLGGTNGDVWAGTEEGGLLHWSHGRFYRYTMKNGLPSDSIVQMLSDAQGNLWLVTRAGIVRISAAALAQFEHGERNEVPVSIYGKADGLLTIGSANTYQPNCWRGRDGTLFFAMANSVAMVRPGEVRINPLPPAVTLEEMRADDKRVWPENIGAIQTASESPDARPDATPEVRVGPGRSDLEFDYTGLSLGSPSHVRFKYRLEGLESGWNPGGMERKAIYRHVPPGRYVFRVLACNSDSVWSGHSALLTVTVSPFFYQTVWFQGGAGLLAVTGLSLTVAITMRRRMHRRLEQLERQHELERERARIAQDLHDDLGAGLTEIGLLGGLLQDPSRFPAGKQEALDRIVRRCHDLVMALDEIVWAVNPRNDYLNSLGGYLCRYAQGFLEPTAIRCRLEMCEAEPDHPLNSEQRHNIFLAFKEALTNVVRHSGATEVRVKIFAGEGGRLCIDIEDNGRGLPAAVEEGADGLNNLRQRMAQIGGQCEIDSRPAGGVSIHLRLPLAARRQGRP